MAAHPFGGPFLFSGRWGVHTDANGLYYHRARYYSPDLRRFLNQDTVLGSISIAASLNRFAYANGNPISNIDPFGLAAQDVYPNSSFDFSSLEEAIKGTDFTDTVIVTEQFYYYRALDPEKIAQDAIDTTPAGRWVRIFGKLGKIFRKGADHAISPERVALDRETIIDVREGNYFEYMRHRYNPNTIEHVSGFRFTRVTAPFKTDSKPFIARSPIYREHSAYLIELRSRVTNPSFKTYERVRRYYMHSPIEDGSRYPEMIDEN